MTIKYEPGEKLYRIYSLNISAGRWCGEIISTSPEEALMQFTGVPKESLIHGEHSVATPAGYVVHTD